MMDITNYFHNSFQHFFKNNYQGIFYIAGGVFKKLINDTYTFNDIDLFFPSESEEKKMINYLRLCGGKIIFESDYNTQVLFDGLVYDCIKHYGNKDLHSTLKSFDINICGVGIEYNFGQLKGELLPEYLSAIKTKKIDFIYPIDGNLSLYENIARIKKYSQQLNFKVSNSLKKNMLSLYNKEVLKKDINEKIDFKLIIQNL